MKLSHNLTLKQQQTLILTPELRQAIELLQMNSLELKDYVYEEVMENPMLEMSEDDKEEIDWSEYFKNNTGSTSQPVNNSDDEEYSFEAFVKPEMILTEYLMEQINTNSELSEKEISLAEFLICSLDVDGYLLIEMDKLKNDLNIGIKDLKRGIKIIQELDPAGIGARNLNECLIIQANRGNASELVITIINEYLEDIAYNRIDKVKKELKKSREEIEEAFEYIKTLEPKPGGSFSQVKYDRVEYIVPDSKIEAVDGGYEVILNEALLPRLMINNQYKKMIQDSSDEGAVDFLDSRLNKALWVIKSIEQRQDTIKKVLESILKFQREFFDKGDKYLQPLTMKEVAMDIEMHESTVSRVSNGKYVQTPRGTYEIKDFFTSGLSNKEGGQTSSLSIKEMIRELIDKEDKKKPYSDQRLSDILKERGIKVSRRTIAKYRNQMEILSSQMRKA